MHEGQNGVGRRARLASSAVPYGTYDTRTLYTCDEGTVNPTSSCVSIFGFCWAGNKKSTFTVL